MTPTILALLLAAGLPVPPQASQLPPWYHWLFEAFRPAGGGSGTILTVTGISPLALVNALSAPIHSLTQYGKCVQNGTPTPSAPVDILCNNGALKVSSNLANMVSDNIVVGKYINNSGVETSDTANFYYATFIPVTPGETYTMSTSSSIWYFSVMQYDSSKNFLRRTIWGATNTPVGTEKSFSVGSDCAYIRFGSNMRKATITEADVLAVDWMLTQTATAQDFRPYGEIYTDGEDEVLTVGGINLLDPSESNIAIGGIYSQGGEQVSSQNNWRTGFIPIEGGKTYAFWGRKKSDNTISAYNRINWFDADGNNISPRPSYTVDTVTVGTAPSNAAFAGLSCAPNNSSAAITRATFDLFDWMFAEAAQEIPYEPYVTPQTITNIPMLLGVGDYKDEAELIQGIKTVRVGIKVFDGTEAWGASTSANLYILNSAIAVNLTAICTHFQKVSNSTSAANMPDGSFKGHSSNAVLYFKDVSAGDVSGFKARLAAQYAAGTPVIMLYVLATEQTEQTTPHALNSYNGTTIVSVTSPVDPVELRAEYKGVVT